MLLFLENSKGKRIHIYIYDVHSITYYLYYLFSALNVASIKCTLKTSEGYLYPMEKSLIFIHKPTILIYHEEISTVTFERLSEVSQRFFEMTIITKKGESHEFNNIERREYQAIVAYFEDKKVHFTTDEGDKDDKLITGRKIRQAPTDGMDLELPSEEDSAEDEDYVEEDDEEDGESEDGDYDEDDE